MKGFKKFIGASLIALTSFGTLAGSVTVDGVTWDPDWQDGGETDFSFQYDFTQFFSTTVVGNGDAAAMESAYNGAVGINDVLTALDGSSGGTGFFLSGVGEVYRLNGSTSFCGGCELTMAFGGLELNKDNTFDISNAWVNLYSDSAGVDYTHPLSNGAETAAALDGNLWLGATVNTFGLLSGTVDNGLASGNLQIAGGLAANNFLSSPLAGFALQSGSAFFNTLINGKYSINGNGQVLSDSIPEPASLAVFGLGLLGLAGAARRRKS